MTENDSTNSRVAIITGGGTGIGRATARTMADEGTDVLIVGRTKSTLLETADGRTNIHPLVLDIASAEAPEVIVDTALRELGRIDVLVNNAAVARYASTGEIDREAANEQFATNLHAPIFLVQQAIEALAATGGTVVNISTAGVLGRAWPANSIYGASKAALNFLTRTWAVELAPRGIRVVGIAPGITDTGIGERMGWSPAETATFYEGMLPRIPAGRIAGVDEIAWWVLQFTRPNASYATGTVLAVDGGASIL